MIETFKQYYSELRKDKIPNKKILIGEGNFKIYSTKIRNEDVAAKKIGLKTNISKWHIFREIAILEHLSSKYLHLDLFLIFKGYVYNPMKETIWIITEKADNDLTYYIQKNLLSNEKFEEKYEVIFDICTQLYILHKENITHRDLKPHNILIFDKRENDNEKRAKICDFGISRCVDEKTTKGVGTMAYMSPELKLKEQIKTSEIFFGSDVWAFGIVCYEVLYNFLLKNDIHAEIENMGKNQNLDRNGFDSILKNCIEKDTDKRANIDQIYLEIKRYKSRQWK